MTRAAQILLCAFPFLFAGFALFLGQDASWDFRNYHWYNAWAFVTGRYADNRDLMPSQGQFFFNPLLDVPFYLLATTFSPKAAYAVLAFIQGLNFPLLFLICHRVLRVERHKDVICALLATLGMFSAMGISEAGTQFNDNVVSLGILASLLLLVRNQDKPGRMFLYGIPAGLAAGLKLTCISFCVGMCIALLIVTPDARRCFKMAVLFGLGITAGLLVTYGHWAWYLYSHFQSPMFPFFNIICRSPLLPPNVILDFPTPRNWTLFVFPFVFAFDPRLVNEIDWRDLRVPILYALLLIVPMVYFAKARKAAHDSFASIPETRLLLITAAVAYYVWLFTQTIYRYLLPLDMLAPLLIVLAVGLVPVKQKIRAGVAAALLLAILVSIKPGDWGRRAEWSQEIASIDLPKLPDNSMVLMGGVDAYAYLLPSFKSDASFVRLESRGLSADADTGLAKMVKERVAAHKGPLLSFMPVTDDKLLAGFGLKRGACKAVKDKLYEPGLHRVKDMGSSYPAAYSLCQLKRSG